MTTEQTNGCPDCGEHFPHLEASVHDHLVRMPDWTGAEVMMFVMAAHAQTTDGPLPGELPTRDVNRFMSLHLGDGWWNDPELQHMSEFVEALECWDDVAAFAGNGPAGFTPVQRIEAALVDLKRAELVEG